MVHLNISTKFDVILTFPEISEKVIQNVTKVTNLLEIPEILRMSNRKQSTLHQTIVLLHWYCLTSGP